MNEQRQKLYREVDEKIGKTPLVEYNREVPNGNKIWIKRECDNPFVHIMIEYILRCSGTMKNKRE